jgi:hypothetical protein
LTTYEGNSGKKWGNENNLYSPVNRKPERAVQAKMGFENEK